MSVKSRENKIFGTDGIRGKANHPPMTVETALALGRASGKLFRRHNGKHRVVIGKDTRLSCYMFENALISGLCSMGIDTLMVGPLPTPGVAFITRAYRADAGIVISASHNPFYDNGIKFFSSDGFKLSDELEQEIEQLVAVDDFEKWLPLDNAIGRNTKIDDASGRYIEFIKGTIPRRMTLGDMKVALDCANGSGYRVAPYVLTELGAEVFITGCKPNGLNINLGCGSLYPEHVLQTVMENHADIGIALDGDADRVVLIDELGNILDGDVIMAICARDLKAKGQLINNSVVATVMSNYGFIRTMEKEGIHVEIAEVGDRYVIQEMLKNETVLGGEQSGHIIFLDKNTTGDGIVSALQVLRIMKETGAKLSELASFVKLFPQVCLNVKVLSKPPIESLRSVQQIVDRTNQELSKDGRLLIRYSGTEPICRIMVESPDIEQVNRLAHEISAAIKHAIGAS